MPGLLQVAGLTGAQGAKTESGVDDAEVRVHQRGGLKAGSGRGAEAQVEQLHPLAALQSGRRRYPPQWILIESQEFLKDGGARGGVARGIGIGLVEDQGAGWIEI